MEVLEILNSWWKDGRVSSELALPYKRKVFGQVKDLLGLRQIVVISGLRRVGKSTIMYQLIGKLLDSGTKPENVLYFSFDERVEDVLEVMSDYSRLAGVDWQKEKCFLFFDEIQKLPEWSNKIKLLYDRFPNLKIVISGSASFQLEKGVKSNLAGRHFLVDVKPLSFVEFLELKRTGIDLKKPALWEKEIRKEFEDYLFRPFPETVGVKSLNLVKSYIKDAVLEKILRVDLAEKFRNLNEELLTRLVDIFYGRPGTYANYDELSKDLKVSKKTLLRHIYYLEFAYVIRRVRNYRPGMRVSSRKLQRIYPYHFGLCFGWTGSVDFETVVASFFNARHYWRKNGKEVDFLLVGKKITPVEVKESKQVSKSEISALIYFIKKFSAPDAMVIYNGNEGELKINGFKIKKIPLWKLFLEEKTQIAPKTKAGKKREK